jgi:hypothetical protein
MTTHTPTQDATNRTAAAFDKVIYGAAGLARAVGGVFAAILVAHVILTVFEANPENPLTGLFASLAGDLTLWFDGLFAPDDVKLAVIVNYGLAAAFWLVCAALVARALRAARSGGGRRPL